ncbi:MAG TPA: hypothetical protein VEV83_00010, partial [Parafilimonas sp.]|nr:hypothetical protein [Parafilimonas sp.]
YVDQLSINNAGQTITVKYSNYKKTDFGNLMPFKEQIISPEGSVDITFSKVEINKPVDPSFFDEPKKQ